MKKWYHSSLAWFAITFLLALCIVLFVGREFNPLTKQETITISSHGRQQFRKGMDVAGGVKLTYKIDFSKYDQLYKDQSERDVAKKRAIGIILKNIDKRISSLGVSDYTARQQIIDADNFIVIEIGGIYSLDAAKDLIGKTVELEFKVPAELSPEKDTLVAERAILAKSLFASIKKTPEKLNELVVGQESNDVYAQLLSGIDYDKLPLMYQNNRQKIIAAKAGDIIDLGLGDYAETQFASGENTTIRGYTLLLIDKVEKGISQTSTGAIIVTGSQKETYFLTAKEIFISEKPQWIVAIDPSTKEILNGAFFSYASTSMSQTGKPVVSINFDDKGKEIFCNLTKTYVNKQMAIFVGGQLMTAPTINEPICGGSAQIDGQFTSKTAKELAAGLNEGALPAPLILSQEEKVSALLGDSAMEGAIKAALIALVAIFIFLLFLFERKLAVLGLVVLISYVIYLLAVFKIIDYAFSLSGIAAIVLSLGMGIDANILIFERLREELKSGKSWKSAAETAYERSWFAILDGNMTTILIFLVLFFMGMSIFKGFGLAGIVTGGLILLVAAPLTKQLLLRIKK